MTTGPHVPLREELEGVAPAEVLTLLTQMGKVMVIGQQGGVTHERIGPVERVTQAGDRVVLEGAAQDAEIVVGRIGRVLLDTSSVMREKVYPRLDFQDAAGTSLFAIVGMDGLDGFVAPLAPIARRAVPPRDADPVAAAARSELEEADPVQLPFRSLLDSGAEAEIVFDNGTLRQRWLGKVEAVKPAMGFLNVMTPDFHLHLKGGEFRPWQAAPSVMTAIGADGGPNGLTVAADCFA